MWHRTRGGEGILTTRKGACKETYFSLFKGPLDSVRGSEWVTETCLLSP